MKAWIVRQWWRFLSWAVWRVPFVRHRDEPHEWVEAAQERWGVLYYGGDPRTLLRELFLAAEAVSWPNEDADDAAWERFFNAMHEVAEANGEYYQWGFQEPESTTSSALSQGHTPPLDGPMNPS